MSLLRGKYLIKVAVCAGIVAPGRSLINARGITTLSVSLCKVQLRHPQHAVSLCSVPRGVFRMHYNTVLCYCYMQLQERRFNQSFTESDQGVWAAAAALMWIWFGHPKLPSQA